MPSFDDLDNTDDELDLTDNLSSKNNARSRGRNGIQFTSRHFGEEESDVEDDLDFSNTEATVKSQPPPVGGGLIDAVLSGGGSQSASQALTGHLVAQTISGMMESALHGMANLGQGQTASSSGMISKTGAKITYTRSEEGESIDFQTAAPTIDESDEEEYDENDVVQSGEARFDQIAEIENSFDFLEDLDPGADNSGDY